MSFVKKTVKGLRSSEQCSDRGGLQGFGFIGREGKMEQS